MEFVKIRGDSFERDDIREEENKRKIKQLEKWNEVFIENNFSQDPRF